MAIPNSTIEKSVALAPDGKRRTAYADGSLPSGGGGSPSLGWAAPSGLADQNELILTSDTYTFQAPEKVVWLGYGEGWLNDQLDGTAMAQSVTVGTEQITYEYAAGSERRHVATEAGFKHLTTIAYPGGDGSPGKVAGGALDWDTGSDIGNNSHVFMFSRTMCTDGTVPNASFQWKQERVRDLQNLAGSSNNSSYIAETSPSGSGRRVVAYKGADAAAVSLYTPVPRHGDGWHDFGWVWKPNTPDLSDGSMALMLRSSATSGVEIDQNPTNSGLDTAEDIIKSSQTERPRHVLVQDYIGNNTDSTQDVEIKRGDILWQRGGHIFLLTDNTNLALVTKVVPLRVNGVVQNGGSSEVSLRLWKGQMEGYSGAAVIVLDHTLAVIASVELI